MRLERSGLNISEVDGAQNVDFRQAFCGETEQSLAAGEDTERDTHPNDFCPAREARHGRTALSAAG